MRRRLRITCSSDSILMTRSADWPCAAVPARDARLNSQNFMATGGRFGAPGDILNLTPPPRFWAVVQIPPYAGPGGWVMRRPPCRGPKTLQPLELSEIPAD